jgi:hypothetical protein
VRVVDCFEAAHVDICGYQALARSPRAGNFALELLQPNTAPVGAGQLVGRGVISVLLRVLAVTRAKLAVTRGLPAVAPGTLTVKQCALADLPPTPPELLHSQRVHIRDPVSRVKLERSLIGPLGISVAFPRELIPLLGRLVALACRFVAQLSGAKLLSIVERLVVIARTGGVRASLRRRRAATSHPSYSLRNKR